MTYRMYSIGDTDISSILRDFERKHGQPPEILEHSVYEEIELPDGMNLVVKSVRLPKGTVLLGYETLTEN